MNDIAIKLCKDCLRSAITFGFDTALLNKTFTIVDVSQCCRTHTLPEHTDSDGFPICLNDCATWPQTNNSQTFGCACECHE